MSDGTITFSTALDNAQLEKELQKTNRKIDALNQKVYQKQREQMPLVAQAKQLCAELDAAKAKLFEMQTAPKGAFDTQAITDQNTRVKGLQSEWNSVQGRVEAYDRSIRNTKIAVETETEKAGQLSQQLAEAGGHTEKMGEAVKRADGSMSKFAARVKSVVYSALVFTVITQALAKLRNWMGKVIQTNAQASAAVAKLKGALLTLAQPLMDIVIPALIVFVNILTRVVSAIAQVFAMLTGKSIKASKAAAQATNDQTQAIDKQGKALKGTGKAADKAAKSMAAFDTINQLSNTSAADGGGADGAESTAASAPAFDFDTSMTDSQLENILTLIELIGATLLAIKFAPDFLSGLKMAVGLFLAFNGAVRFVREFFDAWNSGLDWGNIREMLIGSAEIALGLWLAFGETVGKTAAAISLIVTGLSMLALGLHDAAENGWNLQNLFLSIAGILATGIGIAILTGSWIPLLIAGIAALLLYFTVSMGHGDELIQGLKAILQGFIDFFVGIFTGDMEKAIGGIGEIFDGLKTVVFAIIDGIKDSFLSFLDWIDEKTGGRLHGIIEAIKDLVVGKVEVIKNTISGLVDAMKLIFTGLVEFVSGVFTGDWDKAWEGVKDIFKGVWNGIVSLLEGAVNIIIKGINWLIEQMNKIQFEVPDWVPGIGGKTLGVNIPPVNPIEIPRLATGAVIPPNREFMAVLGDQKSGTNIEAPLETIVQAVMLALQKSGGSGGRDQIIENVVNLDGEVIYRNQKRVAKRHGISLVEV